MDSKSWHLDTILIGERYEGSGHLREVSNRKDLVEIGDRVWLENDIFDIDRPLTIQLMMRRGHIALTDVSVDLSLHKNSTNLYLPLSWDENELTWAVRAIQNQAR